MQIDPNEEILGIRLLRIRDLLRDLSGGGWFVTAEHVARRFEIEPEQAEELLKELERRGLMFIDNSWKEEVHWGVTEEGHRLGTANARKPIKRSTADRLIKEFLAR